MLEFYAGMLDLLSYLTIAAFFAAFALFFCTSLIEGTIKK